MAGRGYSTIPAVKRRLTGLLAVRPGLDGVQVVRAHPGRQAEDRLLLVGDVDTPEQDPASLGQRGRDERYVVHAIVDFVAWGVEPETVEDDAFAALRELEELLHDNPSLADAADNSPHVFPAGNGRAELDGMTVATRDVEEDRMGVGYNTVIDARVGVWARI